MQNTQKNGLILVIAIAILALMSVLALSLVSMAKLDRKMSSNYVYYTRSIISAESGFAAAVGKLENLSGNLSAQEIDRVFCDDLTSSLVNVSQPSLPVNLPGPMPESWSGSVSADASNTQDRYRLRIIDLSGRLNLNDSSTLLDSGDMGSGRLWRIVSLLAGRIFNDGGVGQDVSDFLSVERHNRGGKFSTLQEVKALILAKGFDSDFTEVFINNCTLNSWQDPDVIRPNPVEKNVRGNLDELSRYGTPFMRWEEVQTRGYELDPRSPININTASEELLHAMISGLSAWVVFEGPAEFVASINSYALVEPDGKHSNFRYEMIGRQALAAMLDAGVTLSGGGGDY